MKETGNPEVDRTDVVDRGWGELWMEFSKSSTRFIFMDSNQGTPASRSLVSGSSCLPASVEAP